MSVMTEDVIERNKNGFWDYRDRWIPLPPLSEGYPTVSEWQEWLSKCKHKPMTRKQYEEGVQ